MTYFKILSIVLGSWMVLGGVGAVFFAEDLKARATKIYPEARPGWIPAAGLVMLALVLWTWVEFVRSFSMESFVVTLVMSLGLAKVLPMVFFYKKFREFALALMSEPLALRVVTLSSAAAGLAILIMGLFF